MECEALKLLNKQVNKLDASIRDLKQRDQIYFARVVQAIKDHDKTMATLYANELVEIRKAIRTLKQAKYALQILAMGKYDVYVAKTVVNRVSNIYFRIPDLEEGFREILDNLDREASQGSDTVTAIATASDEALKIILEAEKKAGEEMRRELPRIPGWEV